MFKWEVTASDFQVIKLSDEQKSTVNGYSIELIVKHYSSNLPADSFGDGYKLDIYDIPAWT